MKYTDLCIGLVVGAFIASISTYAAIDIFEQRRCTDYWLDFMQMPVGEFSYVAEPPMIVQKTGLRELAYRPIATDKQRTVTNIFATPPTIIESSTTTTTLGRK